MGFGWHRMDSLFLGGMIAMSSTTIIYKAFDDLGLRKKQFTGLVLSILILEDILAIVLMVMLSTMAVSHNFEGTEMLESIGKLLFFLILWFVVGIYLIPEFLKRCRKLMGEETLLIVSLALCFGMVVMVVHSGFTVTFFCKAVVVIPRFHYFYQFVHTVVEWTGGGIISEHLAHFFFRETYHLVEFRCE